MSLPLPKPKGLSLLLQRQSKKTPLSSPNSICKTPAPVPNTPSYSFVTPNRSSTSTSPLHAADNPEPREEAPSVWLRDKYQPDPRTHTTSGKPKVQAYLDLTPLPPTVSALYRSRGITSLYPWQKQCLSLPGVIDGLQNLVYSAPTSGGKSLVADILLFNALYIRHKLAIISVPFVSIAAEKLQFYTEFARILQFRVEPYFGLQGIFPIPSTVSPCKPLLAVCTIEKANSVVTNLIEEGRIGEIGCIVVDELHMIGDPHRGHLLESMLTKVLTASDREKAVQEEREKKLKKEEEDRLRQEMIKRLKRAEADRSLFNSTTTSEFLFEEGEPNSQAPPPDSDLVNITPVQPFTPPQLVGMSATIPNLFEIGVFLKNALVFEGAPRPVLLKEYIMSGDEMEDAKRGTVVRRYVRHGPSKAFASSNTSGVELVHETLPVTSDPNHLFHLCTEYGENNSVLVFCSKKRQCEESALFLAGRLKEAEAGSVLHDQRLDLIDALRSVSEQSGSTFRVVGRSEPAHGVVDENLRDMIECVKKGVAFHHSGINQNWRCLIEKAHRLRIVTITCCTTTLSAGVNLPARRVVIRSIYSGQNKISWSLYKQMSGRAGRAGFDTEGDVVLMTRTKQEAFEVRRDIVNGGAENVWSGMLMGNEPIKSSKSSRSQISTPSSTPNLTKQQAPTLETQVEMAERLNRGGIMCRGLNKAILDCVCGGIGGNVGLTQEWEGDEEQSLSAEEDEMAEDIFANPGDGEGMRRIRERVIERRERMKLNDERKARNAKRREWNAMVGKKKRRFIRENSVKVVTFGDVLRFCHHMLVSIQISNLVRAKQLRQEEAASRAVSQNVLTATPIVTNPSQEETPPDSFNESLELTLPIQSTPSLTPSLTKGKKGVSALAKRAQTAQKLQSVQKEFDAERRLAESRAVPDENNPLDAIVMNCVMSLCNFGLIEFGHLEEKENTRTDKEDEQNEEEEEEQEEAEENTTPHIKPHNIISDYPVCRVVPNTAPSTPTQTLPPPTEDTVLIPTVIGIASFKSNLPIDIALSVSTLLTKAADSLCLSDDLHSLFLCVPLSDGGDVTISNWRAYHTLFHSLSPLRQDIALRCGVDEQFLLRKSQGAQRDERDNPPDQLDETTKQLIALQNSVKKLPATGFVHSGSSELELELNELIVNPLSQFQTSSLWLSQPAISRRFYSALILSDLANEVPLTVVCAKFNVKSGSVQSLSAQSALNAQMLAMFSQRMNWPGLHAVLNLLSQRLKQDGGIKPELVPLTDIPGVGSYRARVLHRAGFRSIVQLAKCHPEDLVTALPDNALGRFPNDVAKRIVLSARKLVEGEIEKEREAMKEKESEWREIEEMRGWKQKRDGPNDEEEDINKATRPEGDRLFRLDDEMPVDELEFMENADEVQRIFEERLARMLQMSQ